MDKKSLLKIPVQCSTVYDLSSMQEIDMQSILHSILSKLRQDLENIRLINLQDIYEKVVTFLTGTQQKPPNVEATCDLFIGLNCFYAFCHTQSLVSIYSFINHLAQQATICLLKLPAPNNSLYQRSQYKDVYALLDNFHYVEQLLTDADTFSAVYFCSNTYWYAQGKMEKFDFWTAISHDAPWMRETDSTHAGTRRYYFTKDKMLKHYRFRSKKSIANKEELENEIHFLTQYNSLIASLPMLIKFQTGEHEGWLLRKKIEGISLTKAITQGIDYDAWSIIRSVLQQLTQLESYGLYHTDLRTWNIILTNDKLVILIDYGSIKPTTQDIRHRKKHVLFSFFIFAQEVIHRKIIKTRDFHPSFINIAHYPQAYHIWIQRIVCTHFSQWSFQHLYNCLNHPMPLKVELHELWYDLQKWLEKMEFRLMHSKFVMHYFEKRFIKYFERKFVRKLNSIMQKSRKW